MNPREKNEGVSAAETVLYADVLFLINFSMDFLSLYAAGAFLSLRRSVGRMSAAAAIGAVYAVAVTAQQIGEYAMEALKDIDEVAYVRFASVYRQFKDINTFMDELEYLLKERKKDQ